MKKLISAILALTMMLCFAACGGNGGSGSAEAPDLQKFYDDYMTAMGENAPMMMPMDAETLEAFYVGMGDIATKQAVFSTAAIGAVAFEFALVEVENAGDIETVKSIFQSRIDAQVNGGAWYPQTVAAWESAEIIVNGNVVAMIVAGEQQADAVAAFNAHFA